MIKVKSQQDYEGLCNELKLKELEFNVLCQQIQLLKYKKELMEQGRTEEEISTMFKHNPFDDVKIFG